MEKQNLKKEIRENVLSLKLEIYLALNFHLFKENLSDNQGSQQQLQESQHNVEENGKSSTFFQMSNIEKYLHLLSFPRSNCIDLF